MQQGLLIAFVTLVPMVLLSGLFTPVDNMPEDVYKRQGDDTAKYRPDCAGDRLGQSACRIGDRAGLCRETFGRPSRAGAGDH